MDDIHVTTVKPQQAAVARRQGPVSDIAKLLGEALDTVSQALVKAEASPAGPAFARYLTVSDDTVSLEAGFPVDGEFRLSGGVESLTLPGGEAAMTLHVGPYDQLDQVHASIERWIKDQGRVPAGAPWEAYVTDPTSDPDTSTWQTEVYWPLKPAA